jgi:hypothetical protein
MRNHRQLGALQRLRNLQKEQTGVALAKATASRERAKTALQCAEDEQQALLDQQWRARNGEHAIEPALYSLLLDASLVARDGVQARREAHRLAAAAHERTLDNFVRAQAQLRVVQSAIAEQRVHWMAARAVADAHENHEQYSRSASLQTSDSEVQ